LADVRAVEAVCNAVVDVLRDGYDPAELDQDLEFRVYTASNFPQHMTAGVSLFLYRIFVDGTRRIPGGRHLVTGGRADTSLPLDLHFLLTTWGKDASTQHAIAGWMMRTRRAWRHPCIWRHRPRLPGGRWLPLSPGRRASV
jgi:hypothetical protein